MRSVLSALAFAAALACPAAAQHQNSIFRDYAEMRGVLDRLMFARRIEDVMRAFGASDEMTEQELRGLESRVRAIFPYDFRHVDVLRSEDMGNGWKRELYAYWAGTAYLFATVIFHAREGELVAIAFRFNTDLEELLGQF